MSPCNDGYVRFCEPWVLGRMTDMRAQSCHSVAAICRRFFLDRVQAEKIHQPGGSRRGPERQRRLQHIRAIGMGLHLVSADANQAREIAERHAEDLRLFRRSELSGRDEALLSQDLTVALQRLRCPGPHRDCLPKMVVAQCASALC